MSHAFSIKTMQQVTRRQVMKLLEWDDLQYGTFQMERAYAYIDLTMGADVWGVKELKETASFWAWWRNHWYKRDLLFVDEVKNLSVTERVYFYEITHDIDAIDYTPHTSIITDAFSKMVLKGAPTGENKKERI